MCDSTYVCSVLKFVKRITSYDVRASSVPPVIQLSRVLGIKKFCFQAHVRTSTTLHENQHDFYIFPWFSLRVKNDLGLTLKIIAHFLHGTLLR